MEQLKIKSYFGFNVVTERSHYYEACSTHNHTCMGLMATKSVQRGLLCEQFCANRSNSQY